MKRFRITILAVCLLLAWLGYSDLRVLLNNPEPLDVTVAELETSGIPREWLHVQDGVQDLLQAINMSGSMNIDAFLVPLKRTAASQTMKIWFETRDPEIINALKTYYFTLESDQQRSKFIADNRQLFFGIRPVTGMAAAGLVADSNQNKLKKLLEQMNIPVSEETIFISEGKQPARWRGIFFTLIAVVGVVKIFLSFARQDNGTSKQN
ncbi:MAG: hypothetical protein JXQ81_04620 [Desulfuromonadales bacterium]|nr:hypothetical protein [Desulfuromonadales bacterium]MBN2791774.1 hypothetical protein [Desulfuromonadales bacterium]